MLIPSNDGGLAPIQENGHVLTAKFTCEDLVKHRGRPPLRRIGTGKASTFPGFCNKHDSELFKPVEERELRLDRTAAFLLAFRAIAYERFTKEAAINISDSQRQADRGQPFWRQVQIQENLDLIHQGQLRGLADVDRWKGDYDACLLSHDFTNFHFYGVIFDGILPIVACGAAHVEFGFDGKELQRISRGDAPFEHIAFTVTSFSGKSILILGWTGTVDASAAYFINTFRDLPQDRKADAVIRMCFELSENIYVKPSWWADVPTDIRSRLQARIMSGLPSTERRSDCLMDDGVSIVSIAVLEERAE